MNSGYFCLTSKLDLVHLSLTNKIAKLEEICERHMLNQPVFPFLSLLLFASRRHWHTHAHNHTSIVSCGSCGNAGPPVLAVLRADCRIHYQLLLRGSHSKRTGGWKTAQNWRENRKSKGESTHTHIPTPTLMQTPPILIHTYTNTHSHTLIPPPLFSSLAISTRASSCPEDCQQWSH